MISRILSTAAWVCCLLVLASFAIFVRDQLKTGAAHQAAEVASSATVTPLAPPRPPGQPKRFIDAAAHDLTSPFASVVESDSQWVIHGVPTFFALLVYGGGLGFAARYTKGMM